MDSSWRYFIEAAIRTILQKTPNRKKIDTKRNQQSSHQSSLVFLHFTHSNSIFIFQIRDQVIAQ